MKNKNIKITIPDQSKYESFTKDGIRTYAIRINAIGIDHDFWMTVAGKNKDEAIDVAMELISQLKQNDCSIEEVVYCPIKIN